jgi:hypothetical protein
MSDSKTLRAVADRQAITELLYRYCRAVDRLEPGLGYTVWHDDGKADFGDLYRGSGRGWMDFTCKAHRERMLAHSHQVTNVIIMLDGDHASSEAYVTASVRMEKDGVLKQLMVWGRYIDRWSCRLGRWGIDQRTYVDDIIDVRDAGPTGVATGRRDRSDPSYGIFPKLSRG